jgi:hypothetical protein
VKRLFAVVIALGAMINSAPAPVQANVLQPTIIGVAWEGAGKLICQSRTKEHRLGLSYEVGLSSTNDGKIEVLMHPGLQVKVIQYNPIIPWSKYLVFCFRVIDEEGNEINGEPTITLFDQRDGWTPRGNSLVIDTSQFPSGEYSGSIVAYSDKRMDRKYLLFFRSVDHERVANVLTYSFTVFNGGDRVRRRLVDRGIDPASPSNQQAFQAAWAKMTSRDVSAAGSPVEQAFRAAIAKMMSVDMVGADWLSSNLLTAEEEGGKWEQMASQEATPPPATVTSYRAEFEVKPPAGWQGRLDLVVADQNGRELFRGLKAALDLAPGPYVWWIEANGKALDRHTKVIGEGDNNLIVTVQEGGQ